MASTKFWFHIFHQRHKSSECFHERATPTRRRHTHTALSFRRSSNNLNAFSSHKFTAQIFHQRCQLGVNSALTAELKCSQLASAVQLQSGGWTGSNPNWSRNWNMSAFSTKFLLNQLRFGSGIPVHVINSWSSVRMSTVCCCCCWFSFNQINQPDQISKSGRVSIPNPATNIPNKVHVESVSIGPLNFLKSHRLQWARLKPGQFHGSNGAIPSFRPERFGLEGWNIVIRKRWYGDRVNITRDRSQEYSQPSSYSIHFPSVVNARQFPACLKPSMSYIESYTQVKWTYTCGDGSQQRRWLVTGWMEALKARKRRVGRTRWVHSS